MCTGKIHTNYFMLSFSSRPAPTTTCDTGFQYIPAYNKCYNFSDQQGDYGTAMTFGEDLGSFVAYPETVEENEYLMSFSSQ